LNVDSGLQGLSGVGNDMRTVAEAAADGNERARLALDVFVYRLSKAIAALVVGLQRLDALVFTGGIGENSAVVRSLVLSRLGFLGLAEDVEANAEHGRHTGGRISLGGPDLAGSAHRSWRRPGQDLSWPGAGPRPAGRERRLRQAGGPAPGRRWPRPLNRAGRGHNCAASPRADPRRPAGAATRSGRTRRGARDDRRSLAAGP